MYIPYFKRNAWKMQKQKRWRPNHFNERLDVLHSVIKIEQENLGLSDDLQIDVCKMKEEFLGRYNDYSKQILINNNLFWMKHQMNYWILSAMKCTIAINTA